MSISKKIVGASMCALTYFQCSSCSNISHTEKVLSNRENVSISVSIDKQAATLNWNFFGKPQHAIQRVEAALDGVDLGLPTVTPYPVGDQHTDLLILIDATRLSRVAEIHRADAAALEIISKSAAYDHVKISTYTNNVNSSVVGKIDDALSHLASVKPEAIDPDLNNVLETAITGFRGSSASRLALFVLSDGFSSKNLDVSRLSMLAIKSNLNVYFLKTSISKNRTAVELSQLAERTGGLVVDPQNLTIFTAAPFLLLDNGGIIRFDIPPLLRYFWQSKPRIQFKVHFNEGSVISLSALSVPYYLNAQETIVALVFGNLKSWILSLTAIVTVLLLCRMFIQNRGHSFFVNSRHIISGKKAVLRNKANLDVYELRHRISHIGRKPDNTIIIGDPTVSRFHTVIERIGPGRYALLNTSQTNGTLLNGKPVDRAELRDGDLIMAGNTVLEFTINRS